MTTSDVTTPAKRINVAEWVISLIVLALLSAAYLAALGWPGATAFFPMLLSGAGVVLVILKLVAMALGRDPSGVIDKPAAAGPAEDNGTLQLAGDDEELADEEDLHDVFADASSRSWIEVIGWLGAFFVALYAFGLLITLPIFSALYLRIVAKLSLVGCLLYVLGTAGLIYVLFVLTLHLPLPEGVLLNIG